jgi:hypothetical protein
MELCEMAESGGLSWEAQGVSKNQVVWPVARFRCSDDSIEHEGWQRKDR